MSDSTDLTPWAQQGIVLLNTSLTVIEHLPASHSNKLWHTFTTEIVKILFPTMESTALVNSYKSKVREINCVDGFKVLGSSVTFAFED